MALVYNKSGLSKNQCLLAILVTTIAFGGCGGGSSVGPNVTTPSVTTPAQSTPSVTSILPASAPAGSDAVVLSLTGLNFVSASVVRWNGIDLATTFISTTQLTATIAASSLSGTTSAQVTVANPGVSVSTSVAFVVSAPAAPVIQSISPASITPGSPDFSLDVSGTNFVSASIVQWNGTPRTTFYVDNKHLRASIKAADVASAGFVQVAVSTTAPGGGTSPAIPLAVQFPAPAISSFSPASAVPGGPAFQLTVTGANFISGALVYWNGLSRVTQFVSSTTLTASILASDLNVSSGLLVPVTVQNPSPAAGISNSQAFPINNPVPIISSVSPLNVVAGSNISLIVNGSGFVPVSAITANGTALNTTFVNNNQLSIANTSFNSVGSLSITVVTPLPGGGTSNGKSITVDPAGPAANLQITSIASDGTQTLGAYPGSISSTGRYASFGTSVRDTCVGVNNCTPGTTEFMPVAPFPNVRFPRSSRISDDGRYVAFEFGIPNVFHYDIQFADTCLGVASGCTPSTRVLVPMVQICCAFIVGSISSDGRYVTYTTGSQASVIDTCASAPAGCTQTTFAINTPATKTTVKDARSDASGRMVVFAAGTDVVPGTIFVQDTCLGASPGCAPTQIELANTSNCSMPFISADRRHLSYSCLRNGSSNVFWHDTCIGVVTPCIPSQIAITSQSGGSVNSGVASISQDGRFVAFESNDPAIVPNKSSLYSEVFIYDSCTGAPAGCNTKIARVSLSSTGTQPNGDSHIIGLSGDGSYVSFFSAATNLLPGTIAGLSYLATNPLP